MSAGDGTKVAADEKASAAVTSEAEDDEVTDGGNSMLNWRRSRTAAANAEQRSKILARGVSELCERLSSSPPIAERFTRDWSVVGFKAVCAPGWRSHRLSGCLPLALPLDLVTPTAGLVRVVRRSSQQGNCSE